MLLIFEKNFYSKLTRYADIQENDKVPRRKTW